LVKFAIFTLGKTSVEKNHFIQVLKEYPSSTSDDAKQVLQLKEDFPYSQLLHALSARLTKDHGFSNQQSELQAAAVYAADRSALKDVMTADVDEPAIIESSKAAVLATTDHAPAAASSNVAEEVIHDLEILHELKHNFELMFTESEQETPRRTTVKRETSRPKKSKASAKKKSAPAKASAKTKKPAKAKKKGVAATKKKVKKKSKPGTSEDLINEIANSKRELAPESNRQKEQLKIIEQFIKAQPSITHMKDKLAAAPTGDLSTIKTGEFGDNVVSETLVDILIKQGKKDKAIEILKKLIWKFPQKKAYFAAQIEELKR
jgi:hypothetical protein